MNMIRRHLCQAVAVASVLVVPSVSKADLLQDLSAQWWQQVLSIPTAANPLTEVTGANCMVGQRGNVWFLTGIFNSGGTLSRSCSVPEGVSLFFPIVNSLQVNIPNTCGQRGPMSVDKMRVIAAVFIDGISGMTATLDGAPLAGITRIKSIPFVSAFPVENIFVAPCNGDLPAGIYSPSVDDGYYVKLDGLSVGKHTLHFTATSSAFQFNSNVTYTLNVKSVTTR